ncbi:MAG: HAD-IC family P-type ATPase [Hyphomicrobiaceae bacterium]
MARRDIDTKTPLIEGEIERDLTLLGIVGIVDPPRLEVPDAVTAAVGAGIRVVMITGDAGPTALAVARSIGLDAERFVTGSELDEITNEQLTHALDEGDVFARVAPEHKMRIVGILQAQGLVVAMTGDGVNDAPALKKADVGIAMGLRGTDVARGASDIVLTDDNFTSIVGAVEEGRRQFDNIKKFVRYVCSSNFAEVMAILVNILLGGPLILLPVQILWMNLVTDGPTALALGLEPAEKGIMHRPPLPRDEQLIDRRGLLMIVLFGGYIAAATLGLYYHYGAQSPTGIALAQTVAFTAIIVLEKANVFNFRSDKAPLSAIGLFSNPWLWLAVVGTLSMQVAAVYVPFLQRALHTVSLSLADWGMIVAMALPIVLVTETIKWVRWHRSAPTAQQIADSK